MRSAGVPSRPWSPCSLCALSMGTFRTLESVLSEVTELFGHQVWGLHNVLGGLFPSTLPPEGESQLWPSLQMAGSLTVASDGGCRSSHHHVGARNSDLTVCAASLTPLSLCSPRPSPPFPVSLVVCLTVCVFLSAASLPAADWAGASGKLHVIAALCCLRTFLRPREPPTVTSGPGRTALAHCVTPQSLLHVPC